VLAAIVNARMDKEEIKLDFGIEEALRDSWEKRNRFISRNWSILLEKRRVEESMRLNVSAK
jgi:hypothetical protein